MKRFILIAALLALGGCRSATAGRSADLPGVGPVSVYHSFLGEGMGSSGMSMPGLSISF